MFCIWTEILLWNLLHAGCSFSLKLNCFESLILSGPFAWQRSIHLKWAFLCVFIHSRATEIFISVVITNHTTSSCWVLHNLHVFTSRSTSISSGLKPAGSHTGLWQYSSSVDIFMFVCVHWLTPFPIFQIINKRTFIRVMQHILLTA